MNRTLDAIGVGLRRGWTEFLLSLRSPQDQGFYLFVAIGTLTFLWFNRDNEVGEGLMLPTVAMPSILGGLIAFGVVIGPAYALAMEREDGTLLRLKAAPRGIVGYISGQLLFQMASVLPLLAVVLIPSAVLFDGLFHGGWTGVLTAVWVLVLGMLAMLPLGIIIGSLVPNAQKVGTWGMLPVVVLAMISGVFYPVQELWGWVQGVAQAFPMYWIALGMRSAFLPDAAAAGEIGGSWRTGLTVVVLVAWAVVSSVAATYVVRRMARRQSGSQVEAARDAAVQWVR
ncbi:ABC transporter permease [Egibacter rhizosphaerae]|uniref:ABC transporter permease n=1 Tax=Egibacter rhizosphaerae TaxID=1670831 RepID=A0A411YE83_9ACTN|nr:ABC transporter permease [Egibacter rhizosphaerae]QBI19564.1 ABC transporter permease [Egibacter rhizosphaerae]